uniref:Uncharacterized protein n=1 Tax=Denticeps clupeoides TaxID=299321 RepID=A0A8C4BA90_9TELE
QYYYVNIVRCLRAAAWPGCYDVDYAVMLGAIACDLLITGAVILFAWVRGKRKSGSAAAPAALTQSIIVWSCETVRLAKNRITIIPVFFWQNLHKIIFLAVK